MLAPFTSQLFASAGSGLRSGAGPRSTIGVFVLKTTNADDVSVARPGSSDGGSLPNAIVSVPPVALPEPDVPVLLLLLPPPPQPAAPRASARTATTPRARASVRLRMRVPPKLVSVEMSKERFTVFYLRQRSCNRLNR